MVANPDSSPLYTSELPARSAGVPRGWCNWIEYGSETNDPWIVNNDASTEIPIA
jgi:hypothetical protein